jgi:hypothetical protein
MPDNRTSRRLLAYLLAVPVIVLVYVAYAVGRVWAALRPGVATFLGATIIGTVYADEALKRAPATPMRVGAVLALAIVLVGPGAAPTPAAAASGGADAVIAAARDYLGHPYQLGAEGPKSFDCSGLLYRVFSDAGELPRIGGMRLLARGYLRWFSSRGLFTKDQSQARPGDLVVWNDGEHIGIYMGRGEAISALINPYGVRVHSLGGIHQRVTQFLLVRWGADSDPGPIDEPDGGDGDGGDNSGDNPDGGQTANPDNGGGQGTGTPGTNPDAPAANPGANRGYGNSRGSRPDISTGASRPGGAGSADAQGGGQAANQPTAGRGTQAIATGTLNMRESGSADARIIGWVSPGQTFRVIGRSTSPSGWLWYQVRTAGGKEGWLFGYWVREL